MSALRNAMILVFFAVIAGVAVVHNADLADSRPAHLLNIFVHSGMDVVMLDGSMNLRLGDIIYSHASLFESGLGYGTLPWNEYLDQLETGRFLKSKQGRIMSFTGSFIYSYGIVSLLFFLYLKDRLSPLARGFRSRRLSWLLFITIGLNAISVTLPIVHMLIAKEDESISG